MDRTVAEILDPFRMAKPTGRRGGRSTERDCQRVALVACRAAEKRGAPRDPSAEIAVGGRESGLDPARKLSVADDALEPAAAGAEKPSVPRTFRQPHFNPDRGGGGGRQRRSDPTE